MSVTSATTALNLGPAAAGLLLSSEEFDAADFEPGWRYGLIRGVLIVNPAPLPEERGPNELLGHWLLKYKETHPQGSALDATLPEHDLHIGDQRRRADRVIWAGRGRQPSRTDTPTIAVEFVSEGKQNLMRDYETKRDEYLALGIGEYWVIDRFQRTLTVFVHGADPQVIQEAARYESPHLPGFILELSELLQTADRWSE